MRILLVVMMLAWVGCAGIAFQVDPAEGNYAVTVEARDCIDTDNVIGATLYSIPVVGPKLISVFGCLAG